MKQSNTGIVKFYKNDKGFGFIKDDESGKDVFVHATGLNDNIKEGDRVAYNLKEGKKGINAVDVILID